MAWSAPTLHVTGDIITAADYNVRYYNERYLKGLDGDISLDDHIAGTAKAGFAGGVGTHSHESAGAEGGVLGTNAAALAKHGAYDGTSAENRAVAHGLGRTPFWVFISRLDTAPLFWIITYGGNSTLCYLSDTARGAHAVTCATSTNFYVGNSDDYVTSANYADAAYQWVAIG